MEKEEESGRDSHMQYIDECLVDYVYVHCYCYSYV